MSAPTSAVEICNLALDHIKVDGTDQVTNLDDPSINLEEVCARWYDATRRNLLRRHGWNFAIKRAIITKDATAPAFEFSDAYNLPNDYIRLVSLGAAGEFDDYVVENNQILMDRSDLYDSGDDLKIRYIYDHTSVAKFDPMFVTLLSLFLARELAYKLSGSNTVVQRLDNRIDTEIVDAFAADGQERPPKRIEKSKWTSKRFFGGRGVAGNVTVVDD